MKSMVILLMLAIGAGLAVTDAGAQFLPENHYLVYETMPDYTFQAPIILFDQFGEYSTDFVILDKFANPVEKNGEPIFEPLLHQTWWLIDNPQPGWLVRLENQFGLQDWYVGDGRYLVNPALKNEPGQPPPWNHYECYEAQGPAMGMPVQLIDQFGFYDAIVMEPELFCNPCAKDAFGILYDIIDPAIHLACYRLDPPYPSGFQFFAFDQFGEWLLEAIETCWLCVPSLKLVAVGTEETTWGKVKSMYHD